jgi:hypothetical protein
MGSERSACQRCLEFEDEIRLLQQQLATGGQYVTYSPGPNSNPNVDAAAGFRAGWARFAHFVRPRLRDWESRWQRAARDQDRL